MTDSAATALAADVEAIATQTLPDAVRSRAQALFLDYLGVALGGAAEASSAAMRRGLASLGTSGNAVVIGTAERFAPPHAALANGAAAHALEMDDTHLGGSIHLGASVFSAALAAAALAPTPGDRFLRAAVAGYEVAARLAVALDPAAHYRRGFHPTGTCGAFGAAVAAGVVLGLDRPALVRALGIAGSQAAGSMEFLADGSWTKRFHPGWAASAGLHAAALARVGYLAPSSILDGRFGTLHAYSDGADTHALRGGTTLELMRTGVKPHACCRYVQGPIDAVLALRARETIDLQAVERIEVGLVAPAFAIVCEPLEHKRRPTSVVDAQFSLPFGVAVALVRGQAWPDDFSPPVFEDETIRRVMDRVEAVHDDALDRRYPRVWPSWVRVHLANGARHEMHVDHALGDPENFPSAAALETKFLRLGRRALDADRLARLVNGVTQTADAADVGAILMLCQSAT